jgi:hypothetical protein
MKLISGNALKDAGVAFGGYYAQKLLHEVAVEPFILRSLPSTDPFWVQIVLNVIGVSFTSPFVGGLVGGNLVTIGGAVWHFARGLKLILQKAGVQLPQPFPTIPF